ncbi:hypothetical protein [Asticcacaulis sp. YBE204]|nr:hypothetical protein [Asticcacaulis sp. YBE204]
MTLTATCHCGATRITLPRQPETAHECNCSYCGRLGACAVVIKRWSG